MLSGGAGGIRTHVPDGNTISSYPVSQDNAGNERKITENTEAVKAHNDWTFTAFCFNKATF